MAKTNTNPENGKVLFEIEISKIMPKKIRYSLLPRYLNKSGADDSLKNDLLKRGADFQKLKVKSKIKFCLVKRNHPNSEIEFEGFFDRINKGEVEFISKDKNLVWKIKMGEVKLVPANDLELAFFTPPVSKYLKYFFTGMRIVVLKNTTFVNGIIAYLVGESKAFSNNLKEIPEDLVISKSSSLYILAKVVDVK
ncbi:MAG: hypothetical protein WAV23_00195 [Minisyncoccia bacterium]